MMEQIQEKAPKKAMFLSPLRYPGSKRRLFDFLIRTLEINNLKPSFYIEPFLGGGSIALQLMQNNYVEQAILMDLDPWITSFWSTVFFDTKWLIEAIESIEVTLHKWQEMKRADPRSVRDQALTCFFLNRTSFSGILEKRVGPLGGKKQKSKYKIDCRFSKEELISRISQAALLKGKVFGIWNCSWDEGFKRIRMEQKKGIIPKADLFFYLDPPFFNQAESLYRFYFNENDHVALKNCLLKTKDKWILSYDSVDQVKALYGEALKKNSNGTKHHNIELLYSISNGSKRKKGKEIIITNLECLPGKLNRN